MAKLLIDYLHKKVKANKKTLALLIDPDKHNSASLDKLLEIATTDNSPDIILVGGSLVFNGIEQTIARIKSKYRKPVFIFPGSALQVTPNADGILLLSLISGRNPEFLIGHHVQAAPMIKKSGIETIPTGYMLINSGVDTSVSYMSNTQAIPYNKTDIAIATALAGEQLGLKLLYLEAGSGAKKPVSSAMISGVKQQVNIPIITGGGIKTKEQLIEVLDAGSDMVVIGTAFENTPELLPEFAKITANY